MLVHFGLHSFDTFFRYCFDPTIVSNRSNATPSQPNMVSFSTSTSPDLLPTRTIVTYDKSIQTTPSLFPPSPSTGTSTSTDDPNSIAGGVGRENSDEMRARIIAELEEERIKLDAEIEVEKRSAQIENEALIKAGLSAPLLSSVLSSPPFLDFLESSSKIVQRALGDSYDYLRDYSIGTAEEGEAETNGAKVRLLGAWYDETWGKGRSVTGVDWSPKVGRLAHLFALPGLPVLRRFWLTVSRTLRGVVQ